jgi:hypothetical protein
MANPTNGTKELAINRPTTFHGDRSKVNSFVQECKLYLAINDQIYVSDAAKIAFVLSHMVDKEALQWKEQYITSITNAADQIVFPTYLVFITALKEAFKPVDQTADAMHKLNLIKQGSRPVEELVTEFRLLVGQAGIGDSTTSDNIHLIGLFRNALNPALAKRILFGETVPTTIKGWYDKAVQFDSNFQMARAIMGKKIETNNWRSRGNFGNQRDPNAMDIGKLTPEERTRLMKLGACFKCRKPGHMSNKCPDRDQSQVPNQSWKPTPKDVHAHIRAMDKEEREKLMSMMVTETEDF